jgi:hypothetical protein
MLSLRQTKVDFIKILVEPILNRVFLLKGAKNGQISVFVAKRPQISVPTESASHKKVWSGDDLETCPG